MDKTVTATVKDAVDGVSDIVEDWPYNRYEEPVVEVLNNIMYYCEDKGLDFDEELFEARHKFINNIMSEREED